jgi:hypothetical protein
MKVTQMLALSGHSMIFGLGIDLTPGWGIDVFEPNCQVFLSDLKSCLIPAIASGGCFATLRTSASSSSPPREVHFDTTFFRLGKQFGVVQSLLISLA